jgi:hypothetical protein
MKRTVVFLLSALFINHATAQKALPYEWAIPPKYDGAGSFENGYAKVKMGSVNGIIDITGKVVTPIRYSSVGNHRAGLTPIALGYQEYTYVYSTGKRLTPNTYEYAYSFSEGVASVKKDGECFWIDTTGATIKSFGKFSTYTYYGELSEGLALFSQGDVKGFVNKEGETVIPKQFEDAGIFKEGLARAKKNGAWGFIDKQGNWAIKPQYTYAGDFESGYATVRDGNQLYGIIDKNGTLVMPCFSKWGLNVTNNVVKTELDNKKSIYLHFDGTRFSNQEFEAANFFSEGMASVKLNGKWGIIDNTGKLIFETDLFYLGPFNNGLAPAREAATGKMGYIRLTMNPARPEFVKKDKKPQPEKKEQVDLNALASKNKKSVPTVSAGELLNKKIYGTPTKADEEARKKRAAANEMSNCRFTISNTASSLKTSLDNLWSGIENEQLFQLRVPEAREKTKKLGSAFEGCKALSPADKAKANDIINGLLKLYTDIGEAFRLNGSLNADQAKLAREHIQDGIDLMKNLQTSLSTSQ